MSYQPPSSSKYAAPLDLGFGVRPTNPFSRSSNEDFQAASAFQSRRGGSSSSDRNEGDWTSFGAGKRQRQQEREEARAAAKPSVVIDVNRNHLSAFVQAAAGSLPAAPEEKWSQSAIRSKPIAAVTTPAPKKSYEELFPTLGGSNKATLSKTNSSTSFADLMKKRVAEEEEARRQAALEEERQTRQREEEERQNRMTGIVHRINLSRKTRVFEDADEDEDNHDLDTDVYGFRRSTFNANDNADYFEEADADDDIERRTPPYA
jgi:hypothetical protein